MKPTNESIVGWYETY